MKRLSGLEGFVTLNRTQQSTIFGGNVMETEIQALVAVGRRDFAIDVLVILSVVRSCAEQVKPIVVTELEDAYNIIGIFIYG